MHIDYPVWLSENLLSYSFRWDKAQKGNLPTFLAQYNLHDSYWFGLWISPDDQAVAVIKWDIVHPSVLYPDLFPEAMWNIHSVQLPILLINFRPPPHQILLDSADGFDYRPIVDHAFSKTLLAQDRETMLNLAVAQSHVEDKAKDFYLNSDLCQTVFRTIANGEIRLFHDAAVEFLCMNWEGEILEIPGI